MLKDYFEVPNKPAIKSGNVLSCDFTDHETFIPQPLKVTRATSSTYVDCNGFISNQIDDFARVDYLTEINKAKELQKPSLLIEPQSTNKFHYSAKFNEGYWSKNNCTVEKDVAIAPTNTLRAFKLIPDAGTGGNRSLGRSISSLTGVHTISVFAKAAEYKYAILRTRNNPTAAVAFDLENGTFNVNLSGANYVANSAKIENYGNGWYRCSMSIDPSSSATPGHIFSSVSVGITGNETNDFDGDGVSGIYVFGFQIEEQYYSTSYIPSQSNSSTTRNVDVINDAGKLGVFNLNEGTMFLEFEILGKRDLNQTSISITNGGSGNRVLFFRGNNGQLFQIQLKQSSSNVYNATCGIDREEAIGKFVKVAWRFVSGNGAVYANGVKTSQASTDTATYPDFSEPSTQKFAFAPSAVANSNIFYGRFRQVKAFRRGLTDSEMAEITNNIT